MIKIIFLSVDKFHVVNKKYPMNTIKNINHFNNKFTINFEDSSLNLKAFEDKINIYLDITSLNLIKAVKVAILTSTYCFLNEFEKNICWLVNDLEIKKAISILCLKNTKCQILDKVKMKEIA